eukprot:TRINITY_DN1237_c2_g1_i3.p1 TRINITY_DN1237_c2_g1~~TRINITY_DN1237_c2_g1_i3.p1  ORF type:complete len:198 (+),score=59.07 TRINITY_DN1237_c2_g1_i3:1077-1670(+)
MPPSTSSLAASSHILLSMVEQKMIDTPRIQLKRSNGEVFENNARFIFGSDIVEKFSEKVIESDNWTINGGLISSSTKDLNIKMSKVEFTFDNYGFFGPEKEINQIVNYIGAKPWKYSARIYTVDCDKIEELPIFKVSLPSGAELSFPPTDYVFHWVNACMVNFVTSEGYDGDWKIGSPMYRSNDIILDVKQNEIHFS